MPNRDGAGSAATCATSCRATQCAYAHLSNARGYAVAGAVILLCVTLGRYRAAPQLAPAHLDEPSAVGPALTKPGAVIADFTTGTGTVTSGA